jgi:hypothetical protein
LITDIVGPSFDPEAARLAQVQALVFVCATRFRKSFEYGNLRKSRNR